MTRLGMLPEQQFAEDFKQLRRDIEQIKGAQRIGYDIIRPNIVQCLDNNGNPTPYDIVTTLNEWGDGTRADFTAVMEADNQIEPWATPFFQMFYGNPNNPATPNQVSGFTYLSFGETAARKIAYKGFAGTAVYPDTTVIYIKVYFYATDTGRLTIKEGYIN